MHNTETLTQLEKDVFNGLSANPKFLPSKYFYDDKGSEIFEKIMRMPGYYLSVLFRFTIKSFIIMQF